MNAIILAAGQSKRLRPITNEKPKCLLEFGEKTIIDYQIENLKRVGVKDVVVVTGYYAGKLESYLNKNHSDMNFIFVKNERYEETYPAHGLWLVKEHIKDGTIYLNSDVIFDPRIIKEVVESDHPTATAIQNIPWDEEEVNVITVDGRVLEMGKNISIELTNGEFIGVTKFSKAFNKKLIPALDKFIEKNELKKFAADAINSAIQQGGEMHAVDVSKYPAIEVDTPEDYEQAKKIWKKYEKNFT